MKNLYIWKKCLEKQFPGLEVIARIEKDFITISGRYLSKELPNRIVDLQRYIDNSKEELVVLEHQITKKDLPAIIKAKIKGK